MMYQRKIPQMFSTVYGTRIESCIVVYSVYKDRKNAVSVIVGGVRARPADVISSFLVHHPMFAQKYEYLDVCWPCTERSDCLVAVFKCRRDRSLDVKPDRQFYDKTMTVQQRQSKLLSWIAEEF